MADKGIEAGLFSRDVFSPNQPEGYDKEQLRARMVDVFGEFGEGNEGYIFGDEKKQRFHLH